MSEFTPEQTREEAVCPKGKPLENLALSSVSVQPYVLEQPVGSDTGALKP